MWVECKKHHIYEKDYISNPATCSCKNGKYLESIINNSVIISDEIIDAKETSTISKSYNLWKKVSTFYLPFLLITVALLITVSIYCYQIKYKAKKKKHLLPFYVTNDELKVVLF